MKNIKRLLALLMVFVLSFTLMACNSAPKEETKKEGNTKEQQDQKKEVKELTISAAASLTEALGEISAELEKDENIKIVPNYGSSGALQKQIEEGAPADAFISAGQKQMNALEEKNLIVKDSRLDLLKNKLVLIVPKDNKDGIKTINDVVDKNLQIALAETETVPVGQYSKEALTNLGLWDKIKTENIIQSKDVSEVLKHVDDGNVAAGIVYSSDVVRSKNSEQVQVFDESLHKPIVYPAAIIESSKEKETAKIFLDYLKTDKAKTILEKYGFIIFE